MKQPGRLTARSSVKAAALAAAAFLTAQAPVQAQTPQKQAKTAGAIQVDLELVLAVDISQSMAYDEHELQRNGYVDAFRHKDVVSAITSGPTGRIAVTYMEWAGDFEPIVTIPWTIIDGEDAAMTFADTLANEPIYGEQRTSISRALIKATELLETNDIDGYRRVIDVSGDGANNAGPPVEGVRDEVVARGIVINGLPILLNKPKEFYDIDHLDRYYKHCVIGGPAAFIAPVYDLKQFAATIRKKLVMEIASLDMPYDAAPIEFGGPQQTAPGADSPDGPRIHRVQLKIPEEKPDCLEGEKVWGGGRGWGRYNFRDFPQ
ncbi:MAG: DUF1194 domain-containing protein [Hyphomonadaceae bacterium]